MKNKFSSVEVGDVVVILCAKGYWKVTKVEQRFHEKENHVTEYNSLIHVQLVISENFLRIPKSKVFRSYDSSHCRKLDIEFYETYCGKRKQEMLDLRSFMIAHEIFKKGLQ